MNAMRMDEMDKVALLGLTPEFHDVRCDMLRSNAGFSRLRRVGIPDEPL